MGIAHIDADYIFNYYGSMGDFVRVFNNTMGRADSAHLYEICAFAQHYFRVSPLIDFSKSLYSALSFALKGREVFASDIVLYTVELKDGEDYTNNIAVADRWLSDIDICVSRFEEADVKGAVREIIGNKGVNMTDEFKRHLEHINTSPVPKAKLIDVPTNTRMKFQQGVFLMLTDFQLFNIKYFTKNNREHFIVTKYIINKSICPELVGLIDRRAPWYSYKYLTDIEAAFSSAVNDNK